MKCLIFTVALLSTCALWSDEVASSSLRNYRASPGCPRPVVVICDAGKKAGCSVELNDCPKGQICCFNGCGYTCVKKPGLTVVNPQCPPLKPGTIGTCVEACSGRNNCPAGELCCSNGCGHTCQPAIK
ncbi:WAP four-disulfide core domain protein 3-like [Orbicella faveolata]|uniref:WAP four-disulfide core domain protein 3-like n=1 Tax=Orbicella faveolata TaxID=48498 RepID=UPI0009E34446|nr:WAP four-disulfide core domain protein 3-like [Orbicella faveolata]